MIRRALEAFDRLSPRTKTLLVWALLAVGFLLPLRGLLRSQGPPMEEGFMLVFPEQLMEGRIPNRDFLHLYGPGSLWWLAGLYQVFGVTLTVERLAALVQMIWLVGGVAGIARRWGRSLALVCGAVSLVIIVPPIGLTALAWTGAVGLGLCGIVAATESVREHRTDRSARRHAFAGGLLLGGALLFRVDLVIAVALSAWFMWRAFDRMRRRSLLSGAAIAVTPYFAHLAIAGPGNVIHGMVIEPVFDLRGGRKLPVPPSFTHLQGFLQKAGDFGTKGKLPWPIPTLPASAQIALWFWSLLAIVAFMAFVALRRQRRAPNSLRSVTLLAAAGFSVGILPQALQRADSAHLAWVSCVPLALLPIAFREVLEGQRGHSWTIRRLNVVAATPVVLFVAFVIPRYILNSYADYAAQTFGRHRYSYEISRDGRNFYYGREEVAAAAQHELIPAMDAVVRAGDSLIVATPDLRRTPYSDAYLYYLYPELAVGTHYIEMDPGVANALDTELVDELGDADVLVLSSVWWDWIEPNDSRVTIDNGANEVVLDRFVCVGEYGLLPPEAPAPMDFLYQLWVSADLAAERGIPDGNCDEGLLETPWPAPGPE